MKFHLPWYSILWVILVASIITSCEEKEEGVKATYRELTEAIYSTTTIKPRQLYTVYPSANGVIESSLLLEGKTVKKGDFLFKIKSNQAKINQENEKIKFNLAQESYSGNTAILRELATDLENAKITFENDSINYQRRKRLWDQGVSSKQQYDAAKLKFETSKNIRNRLIQSYQRTELELNRKLEIARNSYKIKAIQNSDFISTSHLDGTIYEVYKEVGETVNSQVPIAMIGSSNDFILFLQVDEVDITDIYVGQKLVTQLDAYPNQTFEAKISSIYPKKDERSQTFTLEAEFIDKPSKLYFGLGGESNIIVSKKDNVLCLPSQYLNNDGKVKTKDGLQEVGIGIRSLEYVEILSGIDSSTLVYQIE